MPIPGVGLWIPVMVFFSLVGCKAHLKAHPGSDCSSLEAGTPEHVWDEDLPQEIRHGCVPREGSRPFILCVAEH